MNKNTPEVHPRFQGTKAHIRAEFAKRNTSRLADELFKHICFYSIAAATALCVFGIMMGLMLGLADMPGYNMTAFRSILGGFAIMIAGAAGGTFAELLNPGIIPHHWKRSVKVLSFTSTALILLGFANTVIAIYSASNS